MCSCEFSFFFLLFNGFISVSGNVRGCGRYWNPSCNNNVK